MYKVLNEVNKLVENSHKINFAESVGEQSLSQDFKELNSTIKDSI